MITVEAKRLGTRVIATVKVGIGTGRYTYTVQFADQGSEAANEVEAQRELRRTLEEVLEALGHRECKAPMIGEHARAVRAPLQAAPSIPFQADKKALSVARRPSIAQGRCADLY